MKRAADLSWLTDRTVPWLHWWQELILNWVSTWNTVGTIHIVSSDGELHASWDLPSDLTLQRLELEELLEQDIER